MTLLVTTLGIILVLVAVLDIFVTLFDPDDQGYVTNAICWIVWLMVNRIGRPFLSYAGPLAYASVLVTWTALLAVGCALIYWPHLPHAFAFDRGLGEDATSGFLTALYLSIVTLATLGYGDITPTADWARIVGPVESLLGFFLLSAAITWILNIYLDLEVRRTLAHETLLLQQAIDRSGVEIYDLNPESAERILDALTSRVVRVTGSLSQFPIIYFFRVRQERESLAVMSLFLLDMSDELRHERLPTQVRLSATMLREALEHLGQELSARFVNVESDATTREILIAYAEDHKHPITEWERERAVGTDQR